MPNRSSTTPTHAERELGGWYRALARGYFSLHVDLYDVDTQMLNCGTHEIMQYYFIQNKGHHLPWKWKVELKSSAVRALARFARELWSEHWPDRCLLKD
eukprot:sb/3478756/